VASVDELFPINQSRVCLPDPVLFDGLDEEARENWIAYLYTRSGRAGGKFNARSHIVGLYDPFASRSEFPAGRRWCINVYTGCAFACRYCYAQGYIPDAFRPRLKKDFRRKLYNDLADIAQLRLHPAPVHISNSTDPLQPLEIESGDSLFLFRELLKHENLFTTVTVLTKNPAILCRPEYLDTITSLKSFQVEVTCPFYRDEARRFYEPFAPSVRRRLDAIAVLRAAGIPVSLRIDPIFPRDPLPRELFGNRCLADYDIGDSQSDGDFDALIGFAADVGCRRIIVSPLKLLVAGRCGRSDLTALFAPLYKDAAGAKPIRKGTSYRLPWPFYHELIRKPAELAACAGIELMYCKDNLYSTV
jgi:hypothetical protein